MTWSLDARIPVLVADGAVPPGKPVAWLGSLAPAPPHAAACACCQGRSPAAMALDALFQARARATCPWFDRVAVRGEDADAVLAALREDPVARARFRPG